MRLPVAARLTMLTAVLAAGGAPPAADEPAELFSHSVTAQELRTALLADALAEVERSKVLAGKFVQQRTLRGLSRPLQSHGAFLLVRDLGLQWHTLEPVEDEFVLTRAGLSRPHRGGSNGRRAPRLGPATELLFALFSLDIDTLDRRFELFGSGSASKWQIGMRPRDQATARAVRQAVIRGGSGVESIELENGAGDELMIELREVSVRPGEIGAEQRAIFE